MALDEFGMTTRTKNIDVMYAVAPYQKKSENGGTVPLTFKHALSQVMFKAETEDSSIEVMIEKMFIHNVKRSGTFIFPTILDNGGTSTVDNSAWQSSKFYDYTIGMNHSPMSVPHAGVEISGGENAMLFIPQHLTSWDRVNGGIAVADTHNQSYLQITCKIWHGEHYFVGAAAGEDEYGDIYVPFEADWQPGKRYIYTLKFGGGYKETGEEIDLMPITFSASVENWDDASGDEIKHPDL